MHSNDGFSASQRSAIDAAIRDAETMSRTEFSVYVGPIRGGVDAREFAQALHASLSSPTRSVLVLVDPNARRLEIVTGAGVRRDLDDTAVGLVAAGMQADLAAGDLVGAVTRALNALATRLERPQVLHADQP